MEFNDNFPSYETMAHHSEEEGKIKRKNLWKVFWILLVITLVELFVGFKAEAFGLSKNFLKVFFIGLTIVKAAYIVLSFMHLGHEKKSLRYTILAPYIFFILYLVLICLIEAVYSYDYRSILDSLFFK